MRSKKLGARTYSPDAIASRCSGGWIISYTHYNGSKGKTAVARSPQEAWKDALRLLRRDNLSSLSRRG